MTEYSWLEQPAISYTITEIEGAREEHMEAEWNSQGSLLGLLKFQVPVRYPKQADIQIRNSEAYFAARYTYRSCQHIDGIKVMGVDKISEK